MDYSSLIERKKVRLQELEARMAEGDFFDDPKAAAEQTREHQRTAQLLKNWQRLEDVRRQIADNKELVTGEDAELAELAALEIPEQEKEIEQLQQDVQYALLPRDLTEDKDAIVEVRAGTGGDEASLFAAQLLRMYERYAELRGWKFELLEASPSEVGGFKEATAKVSGEEVFRFLKYESGVHRVQRVPQTETQGRIHTSTATVAVLPEAEEVDVEIKADELRIEVCRAGGAGGQHVNRTESAVQVFHLPTGIMVRCEDGRSQHQNRDKALQILRSRLLAARQEEQASAYSEERRKLIGSGGREEKIRTYNFPQNRITDHRIGLTTHALEAILAGDVSELVDALQAAEMAERMRELEQGG